MSRVKPSSWVLGSVGRGELRNPPPSPAAPVSLAGRGSGWRGIVESSRVIWMGSGGYTGDREEVDDVVCPVYGLEPWFVVE